VILWSSVSQRDLSAYTQLLMLTLLIYFNRNLIGFGCNQYVRYYYVTRVDGDRKSTEAWITVNFEINRDIDIEALSACVRQHLLSLCCRPNRPAAGTTTRFHTVGVAAACLYRDHCIEFHSLSVVVSTVLFSIRSLIQWTTSDKSLIIR